MPSARSPLVSLCDLQVSSAGRHLVQGVHLDVVAGERVAVVGASGSGKSLTADALLGTLDPRLSVQGRVLLRGEDVTGRPPQRRRGLGAVLQASQHALNPLERVERQLGIPRRAGHVEAVEMLERLGFDDAHRVLAAHPFELSGGQRQRVALALALLARPDLLVADEVTSALDTISQAEVMDALERLPAATALLFITHDLALAVRLCSRAVVLAGGRVAWQGPMEDLFRVHDGHVAELVASARALHGRVA